MIRSDLAALIWPAAAPAPRPGPSVFRQGLDDQLHQVTRGGSGQRGRLAPGERPKISAAARWKPSGRPAAPIAAAISVISASQRQPLATAERVACCSRRTSSGWDSAHSSSSVPSTRSWCASDRAASSSAAEPLVHAA